MTDSTTRSKISSVISSIANWLDCPGWNYDEFTHRYKCVISNVNLSDAVICVTCGGHVDTREQDEGGSPHGCEIGGGRWVCSETCYYEEVK